MLKKLILIFILLISSNFIFATVIDSYICKQPFISNQNLEDFKNDGNNLNTIIGKFYDELYLGNNPAYNDTDKLSITPYINLYDDTNFYLTFDKSRNPEYVGLYEWDDNQLTLYFNKSTKYCDSRGYYYSQCIEQMEGVVLHEIAHYIDLHYIDYSKEYNPNNPDYFNWWYNPVNELNIVLDEWGFVNNTDYYLNITNLVYQPIEIPEPRKSQVYFGFVFEIYNPDKYRNEIVARIYSTCSQWNENTNKYDLLHPQPYKFCEEFNFSELNQYKINAVVDNLLKGYIYKYKLTDYITYDHELNCTEYFAQGGSAEYVDDYIFKEPEEETALEELLYNAMILIIVSPNLVLMIIIVIVTVQMTLLYFLYTRFRNWLRNKKQINNQIIITDNQLSIPRPRNDTLVTGWDK